MKSRREAEQIRGFEPASRSKTGADRRRCVSTSRSMERIVQLSARIFFSVDSHSMFLSRAHPDLRLTLYTDKLHRLFPAPFFPEMVCFLSRCAL